MIFEMSRIIAGYSQEPVLKEFSLYVNEGEIVAVAGSNGSGKSALLKVAAGLIKQRSGEIRFKGKDITNFEPRQRAKMGMCYISESQNIFPELTATENLEIFGYNLSSNELKESISRAFKMFPVLRTKKDKRAEELNKFEQKLLALSKAAVAKPGLLLLDEPSAGLSSVEAASIFSKIEELNQNNTSILLAEQNERKALTIAGRCYTIELGENREVKI